jgi:hypothetical protein
MNTILALSIFYRNSFADTASLENPVDASVGLFNKSALSSSRRLSASSSNAACLRDRSSSGFGGVPPVMSQMQMRRMLDKPTLPQMP